MMSKASEMISLEKLSAISPIVTGMCLVNK
jgi:hypothetical protein